MLKTHSSAPAFTLPDQTGSMRSLKDFAGSYALVYFYPKDDTPGCTKEACVVRDMYSEFERLGVHVIGISADSVESHAKFAEKYQLPFTLLSDTKAETITAYDAKGMLFNKRISYLIAPDGTIAKVYENVDPTTHGGEIMKDVYALSPAAAT